MVAARILIASAIVSIAPQDGRAYCYGRHCQHARRSVPDPRIKADIEKSILEFCDAHEDESFCMKLANYLRAHPNVNPRHEP
jgi:hypothetical protein